LLLVACCLLLGWQRVGHLLDLIAAFSCNLCDTARGTTRVHIIWACQYRYNEISLGIETNLVGNEICMTKHMPSPIWQHQYPTDYAMLNIGYIKNRQSICLKPITDEWKESKCFDAPIVISEHSPSLASAACQ
jgi:hypothetical protein